MNSNFASALEFQKQLVQKVTAFTDNQIALGSQEKGLDIYQNNLLMNAARSLAITYPVITKMLGDHAMTVLAKRLLKSDMPATGDWADWGYHLAGELADSEVIGSLPFIADMAKLEWRLHQINASKQSQFLSSSLHLIQSESLHHLCMQMQPELTLLSSAYPLADLWLAHCPWQPDFTPDISTLKNILQTKCTVFYCLLYQHQSHAQVKAIHMQEYRFMKDVQKKMSLTSLINAHPLIDLSEWIKSAIKLNVLAAITTK